MIVGIKKTETVEYTSKHDDGPDGQKTVFLLGVFDANIGAHISDMTSNFEQSPDGGVRISMSNNRKVLEALRFGLRGIKGLKDENGSDVNFQTIKTTIHGKSYAVVHPDLLDLIPANIRNELGLEIIRRNQLGNVQDFTMQS